MLTCEQGGTEVYSSLETHHEQNACFEKLTFYQKLV